MYRFDSQLGLKNLIKSTTRAQSRNLITYKQIPGPKGLPLVGNLFDIKPHGEFDILDFRNFLTHIYQKYGEIVRWSIFNQKQIFLFNPDHIKQVFKSDGDTPIRSQLEPLIKLHKKVNIKSALINSQGERWRKLRTASNPIIAKPQTVKSYLPNHNIIANELVNVITKKMNSNDRSVTIDQFEVYLRMLTLEYISEITFDRRLKCMNDETRTESVKILNQAIDEFSVYVGRLFFQAPFWKIYPTEDWVRFEKTGTIIYNQVRSYINDAYEDHLKNNSKKTTVLGQYLSKIDKFNFTIDDIIGIMAELLIGSIDTTSATLHYLLYEIAIDKNIQEKLLDEISKILKSEEEVKENHLEQFKYLKYVIKETMRFHSIAPTNSRILSQDVIIDDRYFLKKGTQVFFSNAHITKNEKYFKNAHKFDPLRWERDENGLEPLHPYSSLPFGTGIRSCLGRRLAEQEMYVTVIKLVKNFNMNYLSKDGPGFKIALIGAPERSLKLKFTQR